MTPCQETARPVATAARAQLALAVAESVEGGSDQGTHGDTTPKPSDENTPRPVGTVAVPDGTPTATGKVAPKNPKSRQDGLQPGVV